MVLYDGWKALKGKLYIRWFQKEQPQFSKDKSYIVYMERALMCNYNTLMLDLRDIKRGKIFLSIPKLISKVWRKYSAFQNNCLKR